MGVTKTNVLTLPLSQLVSNNGQIAGVPKNPRVIKDERYKALVERLKANNLTGVLPLKVREIEGGQFVVLGGNQRLRALRELGAQDVSCIIVPQDAPAEVLREIVTLDNENDGENDWDALLSEWDADELKAWGLEVPEDENDVDINELIEHASGEDALKEYSQDTNYNLQRLYRSRCNDEITGKIEEGVKAGQIRKEIADVLRCRATQCSIFNFDEITKYFRSKDASPLEKELLRRLYLVFVCPRELFEYGVVKINEVSNIIYDDEIQRAQAD